MDYLQPRHIVSALRGLHIASKEAYEETIMSLAIKKCIEWQLICA